MNDDFNKMKNLLKNLMNKNYQDFIKALICIELNEIDEYILNELYDKYMQYDLSLLNNEIIDILEEIRIKSIYKDYLENEEMEIEI